MARPADFSLAVKRVLSERVGARCSRPDCGAQTSGPHLRADKSLNVGVAAHITSASPGGARYDPTLTTAQRVDATNGIWLCQTCGKLVDNDEERFPASLLRQWKDRAEADLRAVVGKTAGPRQRAALQSAVRQVKRNLALKKALKAALLKPPLERRYVPGVPRRPPENFAYSKIIIHSVDDTTYPEPDYGSTGRISGWFRIEPWDFYHGGLEVILSICEGVLEVGGKHWAVIEHGDVPRVDTSRYQVVTLWQLGRIPWRNIATYDMAGDEHYGGPHLYCSFVDDGMPYEDFAYRLLQEPYDWPLYKKDQLASEDVLGL